MTDGTRVRSDHGLARPANAHESIYWGSSLAIIGIFVEVVRARFTAPNQLPWMWGEDPVPEPSEDNTLERPRKLYIESGLSDEPEARNYRPALFVNVGRSEMTEIAVGNRYDIHRPTRDQYFLAHERTPVTIDCVSDLPGESAILGDIVHKHILATQNPVRETFDIHELKGLSKGAPDVFKRNGQTQTGFSTPVNFVVTLNLRWRTIPMAPVLQEIRAHFTSTNDPTERALHVALHGRRGTR